jgi:cyclopropane-fatty-acyl-phospholipid synthase
MSHGEQVIVFEEHMSWMHKTCKAIFLNVLSSLPHGQITIKERGSLVAVYGDASSDLKAEVDIQSPVAAVLHRAKPTPTASGRRQT